MTFSKDQRYLILDYETFSEAKLKNTGSYEYSRHPSTEILCAAWKLGTREELRAGVPTKSWSPLLPDPRRHFAELLRAFRDPSVVLVAHNAFFEQVITKNVFATKVMPSKRSELASIPPERWLCTASLAAALALPRKLEKACLALNLPFQKDMEGHRLMLKWCKPRKPTKRNPKTRHDDPEELNRLVEYCVKDVDAETALFLYAPPLNPTERKVWVLDQKINLRGFAVDRPLVATILEMIAEESKNLNRETEEMSFGTLLSATQRDGVLDFLAAEGVKLPNLQAKTVSDAIETGLVEGDAKRMLELRQAISKTSTAKYVAFDSRSASDGRLRDILVYHAASTGRWGGAGIQPQNFPRGSIKNTIQAAEILKEGDLELVRMVYGNPMDAFSSCLRNMIVAPEGKILDVADYAAIEARVLFWVARHEAGVKAFIENRDLYRELATKIFGVSLDSVTGDQRFVGKQATLGCGYSMGWRKFMATCEKLGQEVPPEVAQTAVNAYRAVNAPVVKTWDMMNRAAIAAVMNPGKRYSINRVTWFVNGKFLFCELPSGRRLAYYGPSVCYEPTPWGEKRPVLYHWGVDSYTKKWVNAKTYGGKLVENVVQAISRDLMAEAMLRIEAAGPWEITLSVHDELIAERDLKKGGSNAEFCRLMAEFPEWAEGCPVKVEGWEGKRYKK